MITEVTRVEVLYTIDARTLDFYDANDSVDWYRMSVKSAMWNIDTENDGLFDLTAVATRLGDVYVYEGPNQDADELSVFSYDRVDGFPSNDQLDLAQMDLRSALPNDSLRDLLMTLANTEASAPINGRVLFGFIADSQLVGAVAPLTDLSVTLVPTPASVLLLAAGPLLMRPRRR